MKTKKTGRSNIKRPKPPYPYLRKSATVSALSAAMLGSAFQAEQAHAAVMMLGGDYFSSISDNQETVYARTNRTSAQMIDGSDSTFMHIDDPYFRAADTGFPVSFTVNLNLTNAPDGWTLNDFLLYNDFGTSSVDEGAESFQIEFFSELDASGMTLGLLEVPDVAGPAYNSTGVDTFALSEPIANVKSFTFTVLSGFDFWGENTSGKNGLHIREIGFNGPGPSDPAVIPEPTTALLLLSSMFAIGYRKKRN